MEISLAFALEPIAVESVSRQMHARCVDALDAGDGDPGWRGLLRCMRRGFGDGPWELSACDRSALSALADEEGHEVRSRLCQLMEAVGDGYTISAVLYPVDVPTFRIG